MDIGFMMAKCRKILLTRLLKNILFLKKPCVPLKNFFQPQHLYGVDPEDPFLVPLIRVALC